MTRKTKAKSSQSRIRPGFWTQHAGINTRWILIICLGCFLLSFDAFAIEKAGNSLYKDKDTHFSINIPAGFQEISQEWLRTSALNPEHRQLCKNVLTEHSRTFIYLDDLNQKANSLVLLSIKTYKHEKKRLKVFTDYLEIDEFFDPKVIKKLGKLMKKRLGEKGAENVVVENPVFNKENKDFGFICSYRLSGGNEAKEFHRVFLGRTHLVYLDLNLYAIDNMTPYENLFQQTAASLSFEEGFGSRDSYVETYRERIGSYELFGRRLSDLGKSLVHIILIIFLLNLALGYFIIPKKGRYIQIAFLQKNKQKARLATIAIGVFIYLLNS